MKQRHTAFVTWFTGGNNKYVSRGCREFLINKEGGGMEPFRDAGCCGNLSFGHMDDCGIMIINYQISIEEGRALHQPLSSGQQRLVSILHEAKGKDIRRKGEGGNNKVSSSSWILGEHLFKNVHILSHYCILYFLSK